MNTQHLETETDLEAEAQRRARAAAQSEGAEASTAPSTQAAAIQNTAYPFEERYNSTHPKAWSMFNRTASMVTAAESLAQRNVEEVLTILREESRKRAKRKNLFIGIFLGFVTLCVVLAIFAHEKTLLHMIGSWASIIAMGAAASKQQKSAALALTQPQFNDVRAVGPLAEALEFKDKQDAFVVQAAAQKLIQLLPQMKASDAALLSPEQRQCLNRALRGKNTDLILAILKAYEQVGDTGAISEVEKLANGRGYGGKFMTVVTAAQECLPALRQSAERQQVGSQLLRASAVAPASPDTLLRPAMPHTSLDPADQLLRPHQE